MAVDISALTSSLSFWETAGYVSLAIVIIGVAAESAHDFTSWFKASCPWWKAHGGRAAALILIAGLAGEGVTQIKTNNISGQMIAFLNREAADATRLAATLGATIGNLDDFVKNKTTELDTAISSLNAANVKAQASVAELERLRAQRHLMEEQQAKLHAFLQDKPKGNFIIKANATVADARAYGEEIAKFFHDSVGWTVRVDNAQIMRPDVSDTWLTVGSADYPEETAILLKAFQSADIPIHPNVERDPGVPATELWLEIGAKK